MHSMVYIGNTEKVELLFKVRTLYAFSGWQGSDGTKDFTLLDPSR